MRQAVMSTGCVCAVPQIECMGGGESRCGDHGGNGIIVKPSKSHVCTLSARADPEPA